MFQFIAGLPWRLIGLGAAVLAIAGAIGYYGHTRYNAGKAVIQAELDAQRQVWQEAYDAQAKDTAQIEEQRDELKRRIEDELQPRLEDATARGRSLAQRLRYHERAGRCPVSEAPGATPVPDGPGGITGDGDPVGRAVEEHFGACARDAERLTAFQSFYEGVRAAQ